MNEVFGSRERLVLNTGSQASSSGATAEMDVSSWACQRGNNLLNTHKLSFPGKTSSWCASRCLPRSAALCLMGKGLHQMKPHSWKTLPEWKLWVKLLKDFGAFHTRWCVNKAPESVSYIHMSEYFQQFIFDFQVEAVIWKVESLYVRSILHSICLSLYKCFMWRLFSQETDLTPYMPNMDLLGNDKY